MLKIICTKFRFATVGIISGHPRFDQQAAQLIDALNTYSKQPIEFVGVIGDEYAKKLSRVYASSSLADHDEIVITRNYKEPEQETFLNPYRAITHYKNSQLLKRIKQDGFFEDLYEKKAPALITLSGFSQISRVFKELNKVYDEKKEEKPLRLGFDLMNTYYTIDHEKFLDFLYYRICKEPVNLTGYVFPSMCIGYEGLWKAFQFLTAHRPADKSWDNSEFSIHVDQLVRNARSQYRKKNGFTEDQYLFLVAPGNNAKEIKFTLSKFAESLKIFSAESDIKSVNKDFFNVLVLLPSDKKAAETIKSKASSLGSNYKVFFVEDGDKYGAMCAADFGVLHNGEVTVEAAACQLPAIILNSMSNYHTYLSNLYNGHESPLNVANDYEGYEELSGSLSALPSKIGDSLIQHFRRPKLRYHYAKLYRNEIQKQLMLNGRSPAIDVSRTGIQAAARDILDKIERRNHLANDKILHRLQRKEKLDLI